MPDEPLTCALCYGRRAVSPATGICAGCVADMEDCEPAPTPRRTRPKRRAAGEGRDA